MIFRVVVGLLIATAVARADAILAPLYVDADQSDDAAVIEFLLPRAVGGAQLLRVAPIAWDDLANLPASYAVFATFGQLGLDNYLVIHVVDKTGAVKAKSVARARLGQATKLVADVAPVIAKIIGGTPQPAPSASVVQLHAFALAERALRATPPDVATALEHLATADTDVALRLPWANEVPRAIWTRVDLPITDRVRAALVGATPRELLDLVGASTEVSARLARATAALRTSDFASARRELAGPSNPDLIIPLASLALGENDAAALATAAQTLLASPTIEAWRWFAELPTGALPAELEASLLEMAPKAPAPRIAALLGLRATAAGEPAIALLRATQLSDGERTRLRNSLSANAAAADLLAEFDVVEGRDVASHTAPYVHGLFAWGEGNLDDAQKSLATSGRNGDLARAQLGADNFEGVLRNEGAGERTRRHAQVAFATATNGSDAIASARELMALLPTSTRAIQIAGAAFKAGKDPAVATLAARLKLLEPEPAIARKIEANGIPQIAPAEVPADVKARATQSELSSALRIFLERYPEESLKNKYVAIVAMGPEASSLAVTVPDEQIARDHLTIALASGYNANAIQRSNTRPDELNASTGADIAADASADAVLGFVLKTDGTIRIDLYDATTKNVRSNAATLPQTAHVTKTKVLPIILGLLTLLGVLGGGGLWLLRARKATGTLQISIVNDPAGTDPIYTLRVTQNPTRPEMGDVQVFRGTALQKGAIQTAQEANLAGPMTTFMLHPGVWHVHLLGVYTKPSGDVALNSVAYSRKVMLAKDETQTVVFELAAISRTSSAALELPADLVNLSTESQASRYANPGSTRAAIDVAFVPDEEGAIYKQGEPGDKLLGRYLIKRQLGQGAMGVVYRAWDENLERDVAVKVLSSDLRSHPDAMQFFLEEAKALAQLNHPNIVSVFDQASADGETYLIMEFVDGHTLDDVLRERGRLPLAAALALTEQICSGLAYVHARRIIHRDIKPANIFISTDRVVKLGDFGLARVARELTIRKTEIRGTPLYMAPEQIKGTNVTSKVDLYAVGCTLFELVTGRPPFIDGEVLVHHLMTPPPKPSEFEPSLPPEFDDLMAEILAKEAEQRIESATVLRDRVRALAKMTGGSPPSGSE